MGTAAPRDGRCDFRNGDERCGYTPVTELEGRGQLCDAHRHIVEQERRDRAQRLAVSATWKATT